MKSFSREIRIQTRETFEFIKLTEEIQKVESPHTTGAVVITENDQDLHQDTKMVLENLLSPAWPWKHVYEGPKVWVEPHLRGVNEDSTLKAGDFYESFKT